MPYESEKQKRFMWAKKPEIAEKWQKKGHGSVAVKKGGGQYHEKALNWAEKGNMGHKWSSVDDPYKEDDFLKPNEWMKGDASDLDTMKNLQHLMDLRNEWGFDVRNLKDMKITPEEAAAMKLGIKRLSPKKTRQSELGEYFREIPHTKWGDVTAARAMPEGGVDETGHPGIEQSSHNVDWEKGKSGVTSEVPRVPFDIKPGEKGSWWTKPNLRDLAASHSFDDDELVLFRGDPREGDEIQRVQQRNRGEGLPSGAEDTPEMFLHHEENIPRERLVPIRRDTQNPAARSYADAMELGGNAMSSAKRIGLPMVQYPEEWPGRENPPAMDAMRRQEDGVNPEHKTWLENTHPDIYEQLFQKMTEEESRQSELGEYDWRFPSQHGEVSRMRVLPEEYLNRIASEGIKPLEQKPHQLDWEGMQEDEGLKRFDLREPGTWWTDPTVENIGAASTSPHGAPGIVGLRGDPSDFKHQHRDADESIEEIPETYIQENIPPERLVRLPHPRKGSDKYRVGQMEMARRYGIPEEDTRGVEWKQKNTGEPMDIAYQLLKGETRQSTLWGYDPKMVEDFLAEDNSNIFIAAKPGSDDMPDEEQNQLSDSMLEELTSLKEEHGDFGITSGTGRAGYGTEPAFMLTNVPDSARDSINEIAGKFGQETLGISEKGEKGVNYVTPEGEVKDKFGGMEMQEDPEYSTDFPSGQRLSFTDWQEANKAKPMAIALQLLKERKSPEAWAHKLEYDKKYQKTPKRVKYREQLNAERRKRGIYGKGGADVSHTQGGKLTLESAHANRARHFKNRGTLRRVQVR